MSNKTATAYDLADFKTRLAMQNEDVSDLIVEDNSDLGEGPYKGSIISYETETFALGKKIVALIRINGLHNSLIPINKCRDSPANINQFSEKQDMMLVGNHISAVSRFYATDTESNPINYTNLEVLVRFKVGQSPKQGGRMREAEFDYYPNQNTVNRRAKGCYITGGGQELPNEVFSAFGLFDSGADISIMSNLDNIGPSSAPVGNKFEVDGITYQSTPTVDAATRASELRKSAVSTGDTIGSYDKTFETSPLGREWVKQNIYIPCLTKKEQTSGKDINTLADYYAGQLGKTGESFWSSWFFKVAYLNYWSAPGMDVGVSGGGSHFDYAASQGIRQRASVKKNFNNWLNKNVFVTFRPEEAPLEVGDAIHNGRSGSPSTNFSTIINGGNSHMRIVTKIIKSGEGFIATVVGGNEGQRVGQGSVKLDKNKRLIAGQKYGADVYNAIYKYVKVTKPDNISAQ